ncbi:MAG: hypothetical protein IIT70_05690 [Clostridia bacterium]|nr:hypothetical protein [Clostridia bacterium]MBQ5488326.1 hypothetical protein [Clostridia bacterium]MBR4635788.1 hypothetical protein [Clostridia bacterium]
MLNVSTILKSGFFTPSIENFGFIDSLKVMLRGMLSIFVVTAVLILLVVILNKYSRKKKEKSGENSK